MYMVNRLSKALVEEHRVKGQDFPRVPEKFCLGTINFLHCTHENLQAVMFKVMALLI